MLKLLHTRAELFASQGLTVSEDRPLQFDLALFYQIQIHKYTKTNTQTQIHKYGLMSPPAPIRFGSLVSNTIQLQNTLAMFHADGFEAIYS